jgi:hypothetical protein
MSKPSSKDAEINECIFRKRSGSARVKHSVTASGKRRKTKRS